MFPKGSHRSIQATDLVVEVKLALQRAGSDDAKKQGLSDSVAEDWGNAAADSLEHVNFDACAPRTRRPSPDSRPPHPPLAPRPRASSARPTSSSASGSLRGAIEAKLRLSSPLRLISNVCFTVFDVDVQNATQLQLMPVRAPATLFTPSARS